jgi:phospholipase C
LIFGGPAEVTKSTTDADHRVAGVVSTNPGYIMNAGLTGSHVVSVALTGRVPCQIIGPVSKGDLMVSTGNGHARSDNLAQAGTVIGKALENFDGAFGVIEVVVGRH